MNPWEDVKKDKIIKEARKMKENYELVKTSVTVEKTVLKPKNKR